MSDVLVVQAASIAAPPLPSRNYPPETDFAPPPDGSGGGGSSNALSTGQTVGIVVGAVLAAITVLSVGILTMLVRRKQRLKLTSDGSRDSPHHCNGASGVVGSADPSSLEPVDIRPWDDSQQHDDQPGQVGHPGSPVGQLTIQMFSGDKECGKFSNDRDEDSQAASTDDVGALSAEPFARYKNVSSAKWQDNEAKETAQSSGSELRTINRRHVDKSAEPDLFVINLWVPQLLEDHPLSPKRWRQ